MIDHSILHPTFTDDDLLKNCETALNYDVATVCVKPFHVAQAARAVSGTGVGVCAVIGFPHGNGTTRIKKQEAEQVIQDGATEVDMVVNIGKVLQHDWEYVSGELSLLNEACTQNGAILKVIFETDFVTQDSDKIRLCEICNRHRVAFVKTSTGYGFVKGENGLYSYKGATEHDIRLMRKHCSPEVQVKAAGGVRDLDRLLMVRDWGATRVGATATAGIMEEARARFTE